MSRSEQAAAAKEQERQIHEMELKIRQGDNAPNSAMDYEALVANNPNSSFFWIQFITFYSLVS